MWGSAYPGEMWPIQDVLLAVTDFRFQNQNCTLSCSPNHSALIVPLLRSMRPSLVQKPNLWSSWTNARWFFRHLNMKTLRTSLGDCRTSMMAQQVLSAIFISVWLNPSVVTHIALVHCCYPLLTLSFWSNEQKQWWDSWWEVAWCMSALPQWNLSARFTFTPVSCVPLGSLLTSLCPLWKMEIIVFTLLNS